MLGRKNQQLAIASLHTPRGNVITHSYLQIPPQWPGHQGQALNLFKVQGCFSGPSQALPVTHESQNREQVLISFPPAKANRKPFLPVLGCLYPQGGRRVERGGAL